MFKNTDAPQMLDGYLIFGGAFFVKGETLGSEKLNVLIVKGKRFLARK